MHQSDQGSRTRAEVQMATAGDIGVSRRTLLRAGMASGLLLATGGGALALSRALSQAPSEYVMIIDLNKCVGCRACEQACNQRNHLPEGVSYIHVLAKGDGEDRWFLPVQCQHCQEAPCRSVCPASATYRHPSGAVLVNTNACVGCKYCVVACPYGARIYDEHEGIANKCWLCLDWVLGGGEPACVQSCLRGARIFGHRGDTHIARILDSGRAQILHPEFGTAPGILHYIFPGG
jgi:Fe-S-cluster-containing dehydrogenase component